MPTANPSALCQALNETTTVTQIKCYDLGYSNIPTIESSFFFDDQCMS